MKKVYEDTNITQIAAVAEQLGPLVDDVVFVGGCTTSLLIDEAGTKKVRYTDDVDFIVRVAHDYPDLARFEEKLRQQGFSNDAMDGPICRWLMPFMGTKLKVDAMPVDGDILGFTNKWYKDAVAECQRYSLPNDIEINLVSHCHFLATKFEAFSDRGNGDYASQDIEDILYILEHTSGIDRLVFDASENVKFYLAEKMSVLVEDRDFLNYLPGLLSDPASEYDVTAKLRFIAKQKNAS